MITTIIVVLIVMSALIGFGCGYWWGRATAEYHQLAEPIDNYPDH